MELRHLRYFVAVAEEENVTKAAKRLGIQQPPLTQQIQALERELGVQLFRRSPRRIELNDTGRLFLEQARRVLDTTDEAMREFRRLADIAGGVLRVGLTSSALMHHRTKELLQTFRSAHPAIDVKMEDGSTLDLLSGVEQTSLDVALIRFDVGSHPHLEAQWLADEDLLVALPAMHRLSRTPSLTLADLRHEDFILPRQKASLGMSSDLLTHCAQEGFEPRVVQETRRLLPALSMVAAGQGIAVVPKSLEAFHLHSMVYRPLSASTPFVAPLNIVFRKRHGTAAVSSFLLAGKAVSQGGYSAERWPPSAEIKAPTT